VVKVNGEMHDFDGKTISQILEALGYTSGRVAVEVNLDIVPKAQHDSFTVKDQDSVEVVRFVGGG